MLSSSTRRSAAGNTLPLQAKDKHELIKVTLPTSAPSRAHLSLPEETATTELINITPPNATVIDVDVDDNKKEAPLPYIFPQYDEYGNATDAPIPDVFIPYTEPIVPMDREDVTQEELNATVHHMDLPKLPVGGCKSLRSSTLPKPLAAAGIVFLTHTTWLQNRDALKKQYIAQGASTETVEKLDIPPENLRDSKAFFGRYGVSITDEDGKMVNWETVFYVIHYMRLLPSYDCYNVGLDMFSVALGIEKYDLENWEPKRPHLLRLLAISEITGDSLAAVLTLDGVLRCKRWFAPLDQCVSRFDTETQSRQSLIFLHCIDESGKATYLWVDVALPLSQVALVNYDSPACATCGAFDKSLSYCSACYYVQYCNATCRKRDRKRHKELCQSRHSSAK